MNDVEICQDGIPIPGHAVETRACEVQNSGSFKAEKKKKKRKASEAGGRNFTGDAFMLVLFALLFMHCVFEKESLLFIRKCCF